MVKLLLEMYAIPYITVASLSMQERVRLVDEVIRLRHPQLAARARSRQGTRPGKDERPKRPTAHGTPQHFDLAGEASAPRTPAGPTSQLDDIDADPTVAMHAEHGIRSEQAPATNPTTEPVEEEV
jgi:hypothetical protein